MLGRAAEAPGGEVPPLCQFRMGQLEEGQGHRDQMLSQGLSIARGQLAMGSGERHQACPGGRSVISQVVGEALLRKTAG